MSVLPNINHVILLMFENRSFDNVLGGFFDASVDGGGVPKGWSNPSSIPGVAEVFAWQEASSSAQTMPTPDPNEDFSDMQQQLFGTPPMKGFVSNYSTVSGSAPQDIMQYFTKENLPVTYALAKQYAVSDRYFASGPVQTWPNRLFSLCGTPGYDSSTNSAYLNNNEYPTYKDQSLLDMPSIFQQFDQSNLQCKTNYSWKIYYDDEAPISAILKYVFDRWSVFPNEGNVFYFCDPASEGTFFEDVKNNNLPTFSVIEPRYQKYSFAGDIAPNSNHPGSSTIDGSGSPINVTCGENMLARIYNALTANQDLFNETLLVVTYDEHGGLFDHVTPPAAQPPFPDDTIINGFNYNVYGARVPALFINPYVNQGIFRPLDSEQFDHTSLLATLKMKYNLQGSLSPRVDVASTFDGLINPGNKPIPNLTLNEPDCIWFDNMSKEGHAGIVLKLALQHARMKRNRL